MRIPCSHVDLDTDLCMVLHFSGGEYGNGVIIANLMVMR